MSFLCSSIFFLLPFFRAQTLSQYKCGQLSYSFSLQQCEGVCRRRTFTQSNYGCRDKPVPWKTESVALCQGTSSHPDSVFKRLSWLTEPEKQTLTRWNQNSLSVILGFKSCSFCVIYREASSTQDSFCTVQDFQSSELGFFFLFWVAFKVLRC